MGSINFSSDGSMSASFSPSQDPFDMNSFLYEPPLTHEQPAGEAGSRSADSFDRRGPRTEPNYRRLTDAQIEQRDRARVAGLSPVALALGLERPDGAFVPVSQHRHLENHYQWGGWYTAAPGTQEANTSRRDVVLRAYPFDGWNCQRCEDVWVGVGRIVCAPQDIVFDLFGARPPWVPGKHSVAEPASYHVPAGYEPKPEQGLSLLTVQQAREVFEREVIRPTFR